MRFKVSLAWMAGGMVLRGIRTAKTVAWTLCCATVLKVVSQM